MLADFESTRGNNDQDQHGHPENGGRQELADKEKEELSVIEEFLPQMMSEDETKAAISLTGTPPTSQQARGSP